MASNVRSTWEFLRGKGLSPAQAAGVIGSMQGESGPDLNPAAVNPNGGATGIAQWLGARKTAAVESKQLGPQLNHLWGELQGPESAALKALKGTHTPEQAAIAWQRVFERGAPFEQKYNLRASNARKVFQQMRGVPGSASPGGGGGTSGGGTTSGGQTTTTTTGQPSLGTQQSQLPLIQALLDSQQSAGPPAANIEAPSFTAHPTLPEGFGTVSGGGGPAPKADIGALAAAVKTLGGDVPATQQQVTQSQQQGVSGSAGGGGGAAPSGGNVQTHGYPTGRTGRVIGTPYAGTHTLGNWQSDNAVDIAVPVGTPMVAIEGGTVVKVRHHPQDNGRFAGDQITIQGADGNAFFYAHGVSGVKPGQKVHSGDVIGKTGSANGVAHLHWGVEHGDPRKLLQRR
jgi:murein DD-endopeptidase MepM/ murein hydrolase activator NlpD